ncbi:hypothetical protein AB1Y20_020110 [Prymnesium parvum]|uniref:Uncharacterized protein n=1 Tax=Prymnesium parvum TaxID=97485 RepID=A0AB34JSP5_PRYPA
MWKISPPLPRPRCAPITTEPLYPLTPQDAESALPLGRPSSSSVLGVNVLTTPEVTATFELPEDEAWPIIVGATIGGVFGLLLIVLLICYMKKRRQRLKVEA